MVDLVNAEPAKRRARTQSGAKCHPHQLSPEEFQSLRADSQVPDHVTSPLPAWVKSIVANRTYYNDTVFIVEIEGEVVWLKFVAGLQNPWTASFLVCAETDTTEKADRTSLGASSVWSSRKNSLVALSFEPGSFLNGSELPEIEPGL
eukprot:5172501-Amphidinium_carterae.1